MIHSRRRSLFAAFAVLVGLVASAAPISAAVTVPTQPYLMSFHTCLPGVSD